MATTQVDANSYRGLRYSFRCNHSLRMRFGVLYLHRHVLSSQRCNPSEPSTGYRDQGSPVTRTGSASILLCYFDQKPGATTPFAFDINNGVLTPGTEVLSLPPRLYQRSCGANLNYIVYVLISPAPSSPVALQLSPGTTIRRYNHPLTTALLTLSCQFKRLVTATSFHPYQATYQNGGMVFPFRCQR
jgi:hypothetical protein